jgi:replicative DNA helicase
MSATDRPFTPSFSNGGNGHGFDGPVAPPQNLEAEQSVLGAVLLSDTALPALIIDERLQPEDFYREGHGLIYQAMLDLHTVGEPVDALTLVEHLKRGGQLERVGGRAGIDLLAGAVPAVGNVRQYARIVRENAMLRRLLRASYDIQAKVHSHEAQPRELVDMAERVILEVAHEDSRKDFRNISDLLMSELEKLEKLSQAGKAITGTPSGFEDLDNITGGFQPGNLIILAARPSMGKCLAGSALVYDPSTGERRRIDEVVTAIEEGEEVSVAAVGPDLRLHTTAVGAAMRSGIQPVFRLRTRLGRRLDATANHPLLTLGGWRELRDLGPGDRIAVPRRLPRSEPAGSMPDHELVLRAALIADGDPTRETPRSCFGAGSAVLPEVERAAEAIGVRVGRSDGATATLSAGRGAPVNPVTELCRRPPQLAALATATGIDQRHRLAASDLWWDEVASIEPLGEQETYDLEVPGLHNFVADDVVVHNSALMANFAENAALQGDQAVALFSLEMSEGELAQRFVASQASIKGDDLRKGKVAPSRWPKILEASNRLAQSPLYIDDSSDLSVLDVRAKARRLAQQHADGLGLILIDYLQLMRSQTGVDNRVEAIGQISRGLKTLARELEVPVIALSQLNRGVEQRTDKRPVLSDLRESGCLAGETRVYLPDAGEYRRIDELEGMRDFRVLAVDPSTWHLEPCRVSRAFRTGRKPVRALRTRLGRRIRATGNHRFLTIDGWRRLDELQPGQHIALPRALPGPTDRTMSDDELALLGHLIGDGCTLPRHGIRYTTRERELAGVVTGLAERVFGDGVRCTVRSERSRQEVDLASATHLAPGRRNPVAAWLDRLGVFGLRSPEKRIPTEVFAQPAAGIAVFLRHLWATEGCLWQREQRTAIHYASSSERLARDVQSLLLRLGITATLSEVAQATSTRPQWHVRVSGAPDVKRFILDVGAVGDRRQRAALEIANAVGVRQAVTNRDVLPREVWDRLVQPAMRESGVTTRDVHASPGDTRCGSTVHRAGIGRERAARVAEIVGSDPLRRLAGSDVHWDRIEAIEPDGEADVFDLTVDRLHNFVAEDVIVHNSIEQDADLVMFVYRDEYYDKESEREGIAEVIISKHRNGGLGTVELTFQKEFPRFMSYVSEDRY